MRDNNYLAQKLNWVWEKYFPDVPKSNNVEIRFGRKAAKRLGSIRKAITKNGFDSLIYINGHFKDKFIPDYIIEATIAHELCHYAHGFSSPLPRLSKFPHRGDIVDKELVRRNLENLQKSEIKWLNQNWTRYLNATR